MMEVGTEWLEMYRKPMSVRAVRRLDRVWGVGDEMSMTGIWVKSWEGILMMVVEL